MRALLSTLPCRSRCRFSSPFWSWSLLVSFTTNSSSFSRSSANTTSTLWLGAINPPESSLHLYNTAATMLHAFILYFRVMILLLCWFVPDSLLDMADWGLKTKFPSQVPAGIFPWDLGPLPWHSEQSCTIHVNMKQWWSFPRTVITCCYWM